MICPECNTDMNTEDGFFHICPKCCYNIDFRKKFIIFDQLYHTKALFSRKQHDTLRNEIIDTLLLHKGTVVFIKPHPRQDIHLLRHRLEKYDPLRVKVKDDSPLILAEFCIPICLGASSVCLDCSKMDKPAIEYSRNEKNKYNYFYQENKITYAVHNPKELVEGIKKLYGFDLMKVE